MECLFVTVFQTDTFASLSVCEINKKTRKALGDRRPPPSMLTARLVSISSNFRITPKIDRQ